MDNRKRILNGIKGNFSTFYRVINQCNDGLITGDRSWASILFFSNK